MNLRELINKLIDLQDEFKTDEIPVCAEGIKEALEKEVLFVDYVRHPKTNQPTMVLLQYNDLE